jgi:hypothetical protein
MLHLWVSLTSGTAIPSGDGTEVSPFNWDDWIADFATQEDTNVTYHVKGIQAVGENDSLAVVSDGSITIVPWDIETNGPWGIWPGLASLLTISMTPSENLAQIVCKLRMDGFVYTAIGTTSSLIISAKKTELRSCLITATDLGLNHGSDGIDVYGGTVKTTNPVKFDNLVTPKFHRCALDVPAFHTDGGESDPHGGGGD